MVSGLAALATVAALGACSNTATKEASPSSATASAPSSAQASTPAQASEHNQADMDFAKMMIVHHQQAVEMSDMILAKQGIDPRVLDLAKQIKAAQGPEIATMQGWLSQWGMGGTTGIPGMSGMPGHGEMHGGDSDSPSTSTTPSGPMSPGMGMRDMPGMMSAADMDALKNADGVEASKLFLTGMITHHQGALTMAQDEIKNGQSADAIALAKSILDRQQKEIDTMNQILGSL